MKSSEYWRQREEQHIARMIKDERQMKKYIAERFQMAIDNINKEIDANWQRFAGKEGISLSEAKKISMEHDVKAFARKATECMAAFNTTMQSVSPAKAKSHIVTPTSIFGEC